MKEVTMAQKMLNNGAINYLNNFWRIIKMPLINCVTNLILTWSANCVVLSNTNGNQTTKFEINDIKFYVSVVNLSTNDNSKLSQQLKLDFKKLLTGTDIN